MNCSLHKWKSNLSLKRISLFFFLIFWPNSNNLKIIWLFFYYCVYWQNYKKKKQWRNECFHSGKLEKNVNFVKSILRCDHSFEDSLLVNSSAWENPSWSHKREEYNIFFGLIRPLNVGAVNGSPGPLKENCRASGKCDFVSPARALAFSAFHA